MTTERRAAKRESRLRASPLELRLYVVALLAVIYTISWRAIGGHAPATASATAPATAPAPATAESPRYVWIDRLPAGSRPAIALPSGWQLASEPQTARSAPPARIVRAPSRQPPRIRTRSS